MAKSSTGGVLENAGTDLSAEFRRETIKRAVLTVFAVLGGFVLLFGFLFSYWVNTGGLATLVNAATKTELAEMDRRITELGAAIAAGEAKSEANAVAAIAAEIDKLKMSLMNADGLDTLRASDGSALPSNPRSDHLYTANPNESYVTCPPGEYIVALQGMTYAYDFRQVRYWCRKLF